MQGYFTIFLDKTGQYRFNLKASNGEIILSSEGYNSTSGRDNGIASVQLNSQIHNRYSKKLSSSGYYYFVLKASNGETIGISELYSSIQACDNGIKAVFLNGGTKIINQ